MLAILIGVFIVFGLIAAGVFFGLGLYFLFWGIPRKWARERKARQALAAEVSRTEQQRKVNLV